MRRGIWVMLLAVAVLMAMTAPAAACEVVVERYGTAALGSGDVAAMCLGSSPVAQCVTAEVPPWATMVDVEIVDFTGTTSYATIGQDFNDDGLFDTSMKFCGATNTAFWVQPPPLGVYEVTVIVHGPPGLGNDFPSSIEPCVGVATSGFVLFTFC